MSSILIDTVGSLGYLTLARVGGMNALTLDMIQDLRSGLNRHLEDAHVGAICIRSADARAFCAGGDMKRIRELLLAGQHARVEAFFRAEYGLNQAIAESDKPVVALIDGLAMGGGLGLSVHAHFTVVTEKAHLAMPEVRIGFFPDVGGTWFLPRLAGSLGYWLGMTGVSIDADMAVASTLADYQIPSARLHGLQLALQETDPEAIDSLLQQGSTARQEPELLSWYNQWFEGRTARTALAAVAAAERDPTLAPSVRTAAAQCLQQMYQASPHSLALIHTLFDHERRRSLSQCLAQELAASGEASRHPDLVEGVRAVLVDKDNKPRWASR